MTSIQHIDDDYLSCHQYDRENPDETGIVRFEKESIFYFTYVEENNIIFRSEGYSSEAGRENGIASVLKNKDKDELHLIKKLADGRWVLCLKATNHQEIARSCPFNSEEEAKILLPSFRTNVKNLYDLAQVEAGTKSISHIVYPGSKENNDRNEDDYLICREYEEKIDHSHPEYKSFIAFKHENTGKYYFAMVNSNKEIVFRSEGYTTIAARDNAINSVRKNVEIPERLSIEEKRGLHYLVLKAGNYQEIARSCPKASRTLLIWPVASSIENLASASSIKSSFTPDQLSSEILEDKDDDYLSCEKYEGHKIIDLDNNIGFFEKEGKHYFVMYHEDGRVRFRSEGFTNVHKRDEELSGLLQFFNNPNFHEVIKKAGHEMIIVKDQHGREIGRSCIETTIGSIVPPQNGSKANKSKTHWAWLLFPFLILLFYLLFTKSCHKKEEVGSDTSHVQTVEELVVIESAINDSTNVSQKDDSVENGSNKVITLDKIEECNLKWILFNYNDYRISDIAGTELSKMAIILNENTSFIGSITAHTDSKGSPEYNKILSQKRANEAKNVLISQGIEANRIKVMASSSDEPIAENTEDDSGRKYNRRIELNVLDSSGKKVCSSISPDVPTNLKIK
ncbi:MAG: DUF1508 domain-containing protein [Saprospiraceae bacterium]